MFDVVALGELLIDFTPAGLSEAEAKRFEQNPGGAPANVLAVVSKFGGKCAFIGKVGADMFGEFLKERLVSLSIDCSNLVMDSSYNTTLAFVSLDGNGDRSFSFYRNHGADIHLSPEEINLELIKDCRIFHFGTLSMTHEPARSATIKALKYAKGLGRVISFDPNYRPLLWENEESAVDAMKKGLNYADIVKFSLEEAQMVTGKKEPRDCASSLLAYGPGFVAITMGQMGSFYAANNYMEIIPAFPANTVDTTGAGDIFWGTILTGLLKTGGSIKNLQEKELKELFLTANIAAGISTEKKGAIPSIPEFDKVMKVYGNIKAEL